MSGWTMMKSAVRQGGCSTWPGPTRRSLAHRRSDTIIIIIITVQHSAKTTLNLSSKYYYLHHHLSYTVLVLPLQTGTHDTNNYWLQKKMFKNTYVQKIRNN